MIESIPFNLIFIYILCIIFNLLNAFFLIFIYNESKHIDTHAFHNKQEIRTYLLFSIGVFVYLLGEAVLLISNTFAINLFFQRFKYIGLALTAIAYLNMPKFIYHINNENIKLKRIIIIIIVISIPFIFTSLFILPEPIITGNILQGKENFLYWILAVMMVGIVSYNIVKCIYYAVVNKKKHKILLGKEKYILILSAFVFIAGIIELSSQIGMIPLYLSDYFGLPVALTIFSISISILLTKEFALTFKNLSNSHNDLLNIRHSIKKEYEGLLSTIADILEKDDKYTAGHSERVMELSVKMAMAMNLNMNIIEKTKTTGILHDIGKVGVSKLIINKNDKLTNNEYNEIKKHPKLGYEIISVYHPLTEIAAYVKYHHEKLNGRGYPEGIGEQKIPMITKIISVADVYDALSSNRPYRRALNKNKCLEIMRDMAEKREIDKNILKKLEHILFLNEK